MSDLFHAAIKGDVVKVKKILSVYKVLVNDVDQNGCTALLYSVLKNFHKCAEVLIENGADLDAVDSVGNTPLMVASSKNHRKCVELLLKSGCRINLVNKTGKSALAYADESSNDEIIDLLVDNGADVYTIAEDGETPVWLKAKSPTLKKLVKSHYLKEAESTARSKYFREHPSVLSVLRRLANVSSLRRYDNPLYSNSLELIKSEQLRGIVEQILEASSDRKIWADDSQAACRARLRSQYEAAQAEIQSYVTLHPRAYVNERGIADAELCALIRLRDEARRRLVSELKEELSEDHMAKVDARYEYLAKFGNLYDALHVPIDKSELDKIDALPAIFPALDSFVDKLDHWIRVNMESPVENTNVQIKEYAATLQDIVTSTLQLALSEDLSRPTNELMSALFPAVDKLEKSLDAEANFWTRDPIELYPDLHADVQELCLMLSSYASVVRENIKQWRMDCASLRSDYKTMAVWVGGAPGCDKYHMINEEVKSAKKAVRRLCREYEDLREDGAGEEEQELTKAAMKEAQCHLQRLKHSLGEERKKLATICRTHFPELCLTQPLLKFQLEDIKEIERGVLLHDRFLTDYSERVLLSCSNRSMLYKSKFCNKPVAIRKYLITQESAASYEIKKEARHLAKLSSCPFIAAIDGIFLDEDMTVCLQLPYYEHGNMGTFMKVYGSVLTTNMVCAIMRRVCKGLAHLHSRDIVHCDLKLEKILIDGKCSPVIADIDISVPNQDRRVSAALVWSRGYVDYMAPENLPPASLSMSLASDVYAFGICILKALGKTCVRDVETGVHVVPQCAEDEGLEEMLGHVLSGDPRLRIPSGKLVQHEYFEYADDAGEELLFDNIRAAVEEHDSCLKQNGNEIESVMDDDATVMSSTSRMQVEDGIALLGLVKPEGRKKHRDFMKCVLCSAAVSADNGITCHSGHFTCDDCFGRYVHGETMKSISDRRWMEIKSKFDNKKSYIRRTAAAIKALYPEIKVDQIFEDDPWSDLKLCEKWFSVSDFFVDRQCIVCPNHILCKGAPFADTEIIRHINAEQHVDFSLARDELVEWRLTYKSQNAIARERDRISSLSDTEEAVDESRLHIVNSIIPLLCPRCGVEYTNFQGTLAAVCEACQCGFCSFCCHDCGADATSHVLHCEFNSTGCLFVSEDDFKDAQKTRQDRMVKEYLQSLTEEMRENMGMPSVEPTEGEGDHVVVKSEHLYL